jgi:transcriptional repressor NrdR
VRRRRRCLACNTRFTTYERVQPHDIFVIKKDGRREQFSRDKLLLGIRKACEKRPLPTGAIDKFVDDIEAELYKMVKKEVPSSYVGDLVMEGLKKLDHIAYIRFASVYREFADIGALNRRWTAWLCEKSSLQRTSYHCPLPRQRLPLPVAEGDRNAQNPSERQQQAY